MDANDDTGTHLLGDVDRDIVEQSAVGVVEATGKLQALAQAEFETIREYVSVFLTPKRKVPRTVSGLSARRPS